MPTIVPKYRCKYCDQTKISKEAFDRHFIYCKYIHTPQKERELQETTLPSQQVMFQMLIDLNMKYRDLEKKMERIQSNQSNQSRKSVLKYLKGLPPLKTTFSKWMDEYKHTITKHHLKLFFDQSMVDAVNKAIIDIISVGKPDAIPVRNYLQKPTQVYMYDCIADCSNIFEWRPMVTEDWKRMYSVFSKKIVQMYFEWKKENQQHIDNDETMNELNYGYMRKVNDVSQNMEIKVRKIRDHLIKQIQTNLIIIE